MKYYLLIMAFLIACPTMLCAEEIGQINANFDDSSGHATGSFSGKLCLVPKLYETPDPNDCKLISGTFDTEIQVR